MRWWQGMVTGEKHWQRGKEEKGVSLGSLFPALEERGETWDRQGAGSGELPREQVSCFSPATAL